MSNLLKVTCSILRLAPYLVLIGTANGSAHPERGMLETLSFSPADYNGAPQNWAVVQGPRGLIYIGNTNGILEYDGVNWRNISTDRKTAARSLALGPDGLVYVGGQAEIGYLDPDALGAMQFVSLNSFIPEEAREFADIWWTLATDRGIFFQSQQQIFRWHDGQITHWHLSNAMLRMYQVGQRILLKDRDMGLLELKNDSFQPVPGADKINPLSVAAILSTPNDEDPEALLLIMSDGATWRYHKGSFKPLEAHPENQLSVARIYHGRTIRPNLHAIATLGNGLLLLDNNGNLVDHLNEANGLKSNNVYSFAQERTGSLWIGLSTGIVRIDPFSPVSRFDNRNGLPDIILGTVRHQNTLFVASTQGLFKLVSNKIQKVDGIGGPVWDLESAPQGLLIADATGLFLLTDDEVKLLSPTRPVMVIEADPTHPARWWLGFSRGLKSISYETGQWVEDKVAVELASFVRSIAEDHDGFLVLGTEQDGVIRFDPSASRGPDGRVLEQSVERFGVEEGLISPNRTQAMETHDGVLVWNQAKVFRFKEEENRLEPDADLAAMLKSQGIEGLEMLTGIRNDGALVLSDQGGYTVGLGIPDKDGYSWSGRALMAVRHRSIFGGRFDEDGTLWLATDSGLYRIESNHMKPTKPFPAMLRSLSYLDSNDALFAGGIPSESFFPKPYLPFTRRALRFSFSTAWYEHPEENSYQIWLEGLNEDWSEWTKDTYRDFTNLREGSYRLRVRARNFYGDISTEDAFNFTVLPPWYRTPWAFIVYGLTGILLLWVVAKLRTRSLQLEKLHLEQIVRERTADLEESRSRAEQAAAAKSSFLATISHEIRTPLNAILGFARLGRKETNGEEIRTYLGKIDNASVTLLALVNDVLDMSRIEAGKLSLNPVSFDLLELLAEIEELFELQARDQNLRFTVEIDENVPRFVECDALRLRQVLINLVGNALKFTFQGRVEVSVSLADNSHPILPDTNARICFNVRDTGVGIHPDRLESLFEPYTQAKANITRRKGGAGLGLSIVRHIVELLGGKLQAESTPSKGSRFSFELDLPVRTCSTSSMELEPLGRLDNLAILLVEDNKTNQEIAAQMLRSVGARVHIAENGSEAVNAVEEGTFDAILMDLHMPVMDGREATKHIRRLQGGEQLPIIAMTAHAVTGVRDQCLADGMNDYVSKPFDPVFLVKVLQRWTSGSKPALDLLSPAEEQDTVTSSNLETKKALARVHGDTALYRRLLGDFLVQQRNCIEEVKALIDQQEIESACSFLHRLTGVAANLGMSRFAQDAKELGQALRSKADPESLSAKITSFSLHFGEAVAAIEKKISEFDTVPVEADRKPFDAELIKQLMHSLKNSDPVAETIWLQNREAINHMIEPNQISELEQAIYQFNYSGALRILKNLSTSKDGP